MAKVKPEHVELITVPGESFSIVHLGHMQLADNQTFLVCSRLIMENLVQFHAHSDRDVFTATRTPEELTIVCREKVVPAALKEKASKIVPGYRALRIKGQMDLNVVGVIAHITATLAHKDIAVFVTSTYDTDYIFVKTDSFNMAQDVLKKAGHKVTEGKEPTSASTLLDPNASFQWTCPRCTTGTRNPHTLDLCTVCQAPRPASVRRPSATPDPVTPVHPKYSEFQKADVDKPTPLTKPDYFKLPAEAIDMKTLTVNPQALKEAQEKASKKRAEKGNKTSYLALDNKAVESSSQGHKRSHSTGNAPSNAASNYSTMGAGSMVDHDGTTKKKGYIDMDKQDFKLHASAISSASTGGHSTPGGGRHRTDSGAGEESFDMPPLRDSFKSNYTTSLASGDFPESGPPIQRTHATIGGVIRDTGGGSGGVDGHLPTGSAQLGRSNSTSGEEQGGYSSVSALDGKWTAAESRLDLDIEHKPYFRGELGRGSAQKALESKPLGTFLFRLCSDKNEADMHGHVFVLNYINATDKRFSNVKIYRFPTPAPNAAPNSQSAGWCMHRDRRGTVYPNLDIIIRAINFGVAPTPFSDK